MSIKISSSNKEMLEINKKNLSFQALVKIKVPLNALKVLLAIPPCSLKNQNHPRNIS